MSRSRILGGICSFSGEEGLRIVQCAPTVAISWQGVETGSQQVPGLSDYGDTISGVLLIEPELVAD